MFEICLWQFPELQTKYVNEKRVYITPQNKEYLSVTTILGILSESSKSLQAWKDRLGEKEAKRVAGVAAKRGDGLHKICENYLLGKDYKAESNPITLNMFNSIKRVLEQNITKVHGLEFTLYSDELLTAGRIDNLCVWNGALSILDFKTASKPKKKKHIIGYIIQCVAYALMVYYYFGVYIDQIVILVAVEHEAPQIFIEKVSDWQDRVYDFFTSKEIAEYKANLLIPK